MFKNQLLPMSLSKYNGAMPGAGSRPTVVWSRHEASMEHSEPIRSHTQAALVRNLESSGLEDKDHDIIHSVPVLDGRTRNHRAVVPCVLLGCQRGGRRPAECKKPRGSRGRSRSTHFTRLMSVLRVWPTWRDIHRSRQACRGAPIFSKAAELKRSARHYNSVA
jgi:hypothetical protein